MAQYGLQMISAFQALAWLEVPMRLFSFLGTTQFFLLVLPIIYWCMDARLGIRVGFILLIGTGLNLTLKLAFHEPRPYWISADILALSAESTFGMPSGHAQTAAGLWALIALHLRRRWAWITALALILCIGLSRIYLGVHFPLDVLAGWILGALTLWAFAMLWEPASAWMLRESRLRQIIPSIVLPAILILLGAALVYSLRDYQLPAEWMVNAARAGEPLPAPTSLEPTIATAAALCGLSLGLVVTQRAGGFSPSGPIKDRALCFMVGLFGITLVNLVLGAVLPHGESTLGLSMRFVRYAALGFWVTAGAPWAFRILGLNRAPSTA